MVSFLSLASSSFYETLTTAVWILLPIFFAMLFWQLRLQYKRMQFLAKVEWQILEIKIPDKNEKSLRSMEQVFASLFGMYSFGIKWMDKYLDGKVDLWMSFEMVGRGGVTSFYVRTPSQFRHLLESSVYAQFPDAEIVPAQDYTQELPSMLPNETFDLMGFSYNLIKGNAYPIKTYDFFEQSTRMSMDRSAGPSFLDPLSPVFEAMSKLKDNEMIWMQLLISPTGGATGNDIKKEGEAEIKKIMDDNTPKKEGVPSGAPVLSGGKRDIIAAIERKISKHAFQFTLRFMYIDKKDSFSPLNIAAVNGALQQFNTQNMNGFKPGFVTAHGGWMAKLVPSYKKSKVLAKKRMMYDYFVKRRFGISNRIADEALPVLSSEELATIFHFPTSVVKAPRIQHIDSRRGGAPVNLPVE